MKLIMYIIIPYVENFVSQILFELQQIIKDIEILN